MIKCLQGVFMERKFTLIGGIGNIILSAISIGLYLYFILVLGITLQGSELLTADILLVLYWIALFVSAVNLVLSLFLVFQWKNSVEDFKVFLPISVFITNIILMIFSFFEFTVYSFVFLVLHAVFATLILIDYLKNREILKEEANN